MKWVADVQIVTNGAMQCVLEYKRLQDTQKIDDKMLEEDCEKIDVTRRQVHTAVVSKNSITPTGTSILRPTCPFWSKTRIMIQKSAKNIPFKNTHCGLAGTRVQMLEIVLTI